MNDPVPDLSTDPLLSGIPEVEGYKVLEPCVLFAKLGEGGMGTVYRGRHMNLEIDVAVKCLKRGLAEGSPAFVTRFQREARLAASIHHQNLVQVYDVSQKNGVHYLVMEYVRGETARERVARKGPLKESEALRILLGAAAGLSEAHAQRVVHRDIKPDNILISFDGKVKVSDLGLAKALEGQEGVSLTMGVMGTPQYMAPEQWDDSSHVSPAADVWALGATLYFLLTGENAIASGTIQQVCRRICLEPFPALQHKLPEVSAPVVALLERCLHKDPTQRFADCREMSRELMKITPREKDAKALVDPDTGSVVIQGSLLSPPPAESLARIRLTLGEEATLTGTPSPPSKSATPSPGASVKTPSSPAGESRTESFPRSTERARRAWVWPSAAALVVSLSLVIVWRSWFGDSQAASRSEEARPEQLSTPSGPPGLAGVGPSEGLRTATGTVLPVTDTSEPVEGEQLALPHLVLDAPFADQAQHFTREKELLLTGQFSPSSASLVCTLDGVSQPVELVEGERFSIRLDTSSEGRHDCVLRLANASLEHLLEIRVDRTAPEVRWGRLPTGPSAERELSLDWSLVDASPVDSFTVAGESLLGSEAGLSGTWTAQGVAEGHNAFAWRAVDRAGNEANGALEIELDWTAPRLVAIHPALETLLKPGPFEFVLEFSEPPLDATVAELATVLDGARLRGSLVLERGHDEFVVSWKAQDAVGNPASDSLRWRVQRDPWLPLGWINLDPSDVDSEFRGRYALDPSSGVRFRLLPAVPERGITHPLYAAETEVTREQWSCFRSPSGRQFAALQSHYPMQFVSHTEANAFCEHFGYGLPTAREWDLLCRPSPQGDWGFDGDVRELELHAWFRGNARSKLQPVAVLRPNAWGLFDLHGSLAEWTRDPSTDGRGSCAHGGSFFSKAGDCSALAPPEVSNGAGRENTGFRPVFRLRP